MPLLFGEVLVIQPPTDNLYKLVAIFGLIVWGFSFYIPLQKLDEAQLEFAKWNAEWNPILFRALDVDNNAREQLECAIADAKVSVNDPNPDQYCEAIEAKFLEQKLAASNLELNMAELRGRKNIVDELEKRYDRYRCYGLVCTFVGFVTMILGFWCWYVKVQRPLDLALRREADK